MMAELNLGTGKGISLITNKRVVSFWNKLPTDIKMAQSIDSFKFVLEGYKLRHINGTVIDT